MNRFRFTASLVTTLAFCFSAAPARANTAEQIKAGFQKVGELFRASLEQTRSRFIAAGEKIKQAFKDLGEKIEALGKKVKASILAAVDKVKAKMAAFGDQIRDKLKGFITDAIATLLDTATNLIGFKIDDLKEVLGEDGKVNRSKVREIVIRRILSQYVAPMLAEKVPGLLSSALSAILPFIDAAVSAVIGGLGSIPGVGGLLAGAIHMAYSLGITALRTVAANAIGKWVTGFLVEQVAGVLINFAAKKPVEWANARLDSLRDKWPGLTKKMDAVFAGFYEGLEAHLKPAGATCTLAK